MTSQQHAPRHRSATGRGFGRDPHPSLPLPVVPAPRRTVPGPAPDETPTAAVPRRLARVLGVVVVVLAVVVAGLAVAELVAPSARTPAPVVAGATTAPTPTPFGDTFTYTDGTAVRVGAPAVYRPSRSAAGDVHPYAYVATLTVVNAGSSPLDPATVRLGTTVGARATEEIVDAAKGPGVAPAGVVPAGGTASWTVAFSSSADRGPVVIDVDPGAGRHHAVFAGPL